MARVDKTQSAIAVTRARIAADFDEADFDKVIPAGLDAQGRVVKGAGQSGIVGVVIPGRTVHTAGQIADIFGNGTEIVEAAGLAAGTAYYVDATGAITDAADDGGAPAVANTRLGFTVEADRLVVTI